VVTSPDPVYAAAITSLREDKVVLDFAEFHQPDARPGADESEDQLSTFAMEASLPA